MYLFKGNENCNKQLTTIHAQCLMRAVSSMNDGVIILDDKQEIVYHNTAYEEFVEWTGESKPPLLEFRYPNGETCRELLQLVYIKGSWTGEALYLTKQNEQRYFSVALTKVEVEGTYFIGIIRDITEYKLERVKHEYLAYHDSLTGLPNRLNFLEQLKACLKSAKEAKSQFALMFIDIDEFKEVNDRYGHHVGDELLVHVAQRLEHAIRGYDVAARFGGDEFIILLKNISEEETVRVISKRILTLFQHPLAFNNNIVPVTASIGVSIFPDDAATMEELLVHADRAMYKAKHNGKNRFCIYRKS